MARIVERARLREEGGRGRAEFNFTDNHDDDDTAGCSGSVGGVSGGKSGRPIAIAIPAHF